MVESAPPISIAESLEYSRWLIALRDLRARARILKAVDRLSLGHFGNVKPVGGGLRELRIDYGPGYRIYFMLRGKNLILLAYGGDKSRQKADIERARQIAARWELDDGD